MGAPRNASSTAAINATPKIRMRPRTSWASGTPVRALIAGGNTGRHRREQLHFAEREGAVTPRGADAHEPALAVQVAGVSGPQPGAARHRLGVPQRLVLAAVGRHLDPVAIVVVPLQPGGGDRGDLAQVVDDEGVGIPEAGGDAGLPEVPFRARRGRRSGDRRGPRPIGHGPPCPPAGCPRRPGPAGPPAAPARWPARTSEDARRIESCRSLLHARGRSLSPGPAPASRRGWRLGRDWLRGRRATLP